MEQSKKWEKTSKGQYSLYFNDQLSGTINIAMGAAGRKANAIIGNREYLIKQTGVWKNKIEITNQNGAIVGKLYPEKWYASTSVFEFDGKTYKVIVRNNPLAEYAIQENGKDLLSYGIYSENKEIKIRITSSQNSDFLFDFLLWYLFVPIAYENFSDDMLFMVLIASA